MASIKMKFRPSTCPDRAGVIYFQIIHRRSVRQVLTIYRVRHLLIWPNFGSRIFVTVIFTIREVKRDSRSV